VQNVARNNKRNGIGLTGHADYTMQSALRGQYSFKNNYDLADAMHMVFVSFFFVLLEA
jgi:hypothetical protein